MKRFWRWLGRPPHLTDDPAYVERVTVVSVAVAVTLIIACSAAGAPWYVRALLWLYVLVQVFQLVLLMAVQDWLESYGRGLEEPHKLSRRDALAWENYVDNVRNRLN